MTLQQTVPSSDNELSKEEMIFISDHMAACASYLEHLDTLWIGDEGVLDADILAKLETDIPEMPANLGVKLQRRVSKGVQRGSLATSALKLGTQGMLQVLLAMIRPIISGGKSSEES